MFIGVHPATSPHRFSFLIQRGDTLLDLAWNNSKLQFLTKLTNPKQPWLQNASHPSVGNPVQHVEQLTHGAHLYVTLQVIS